MVAIVRCESYDEEMVYLAVKRALDLIGGLASIVKPGEKILLKPNILTGAPPDKAVCTHPAVFNAVARILCDAGFNPRYGDSPASDKPESGLARAGITEVAKRYGLELGDFENSVEVKGPSPGANWSFPLARAVAEADCIISLPKMKTHMLTRVTGAVKNQFGCILGKVKGSYHVKLPGPSDFSRMLVELNLAVKARLFVMDGIVAMEGNGPRGGDPVPMKVLLVSTDPVAVDATFCRMVALDPRFVPTNVFGQRNGLGNWEESGIELVGDPLDSFMNRQFNVVRKTAAGGAIPPALLNLVSDRPVIEAALCIKCGKCVDSCPVEGKALDFVKGDKKKPPAYKYNSCIRCYCCQESCPEKAITVRKPTLMGIITGKQN